MNTFIKLTCLVIYAIGFLAPLFASELGLSARVVFWTQWIALAVILSHVAELVLFFNIVRRYPGALIDSIALTLLFGLLHWLPLRQSPAK